MTKYLQTLTTIIAVLMLSTVIQAQQGSVTGTVQSQSGEILIGVNIIIDGTTTGTTTDINGTYTLADLNPGSYTIVASYVGFERAKKQVEVRANETTRADFVLNRSFDMPQIELIGQRPQRLDRVPGSAAVVTEQQIIDIAPISGHEVFRRIPGVHAVEEEGVGLRANIGIRGLDPSKSRSVLMLEDGIPVALAPYGEPEMYYTPAMDRMAGIELVKGSGSILFGPQTFGGVLNYVTADPPAEETASVHVRGGEGGYFTGRMNYGNTVGNTGYTVTYLHKRGDEVGLVNYQLNDLSSKIKLVTGDRSIVGLKLGYYDETSNSTYVGLTQQMFDMGGFDFTHLAPDDQLDVRRYSASITHDYFLNENVTLRTTAFGYTSTRNWSRQDFDNVFNPDRDYARIVGNPDIEGGAIYFRNTTGNRNRQFEVAGIEPRISVNYAMGSVRNELDAGVRYLYERAFEQRVNGVIDSPQSGDLRDDEIRTGHAISTYIQNAFLITDQLTVTPGVRLEHFSYERDIRRLGFDDVNITNSDVTTELIPGIGFNYFIRDGVSFYGGIHRGYGPPRVKDAISPEGVSQELDAEQSWNVELGTRARLARGLDVELTGFYMDFSNQIIPVSEAAGGTGRPGVSLVNGGSTEHLGVEVRADLDFQQIIDSKWGINLNTSATFLSAEFSSDRLVSFGGDQVNVKGNKVPYAPEVMVSSDLSVMTPFNFELSLTGTYLGKQYGDPLNLEEGSLDGRSGVIDPYFVLDARANYRIHGMENASVSLSVKNLLDERYIVSRRPQGIRLGLPRFITAGVDWRF